MVPGPFDYYEAATIEEALDLLTDHGPAGTALLAGGHSLVPDMKRGRASPDVVVDIDGIEALQGIDREGDTLSVGAVTRYTDLLDAPVAREHAPAITAAVRALGDRQVRNRGTVGGNLAQADPAADLPGAMVAADATVVAVGPDGERSVPVQEFFHGAGETALAPDELLARVELPVAGKAVGAYAKKDSPASGYAMVGVAVRLTVADGEVETARVGASGACDRGVRLPGVEAELTGATLDDATVEPAAARATEGLDVELRADREASAAFRGRLLEVYTERALEQATDEAAAAGVTAP